MLTRAQQRGVGIDGCQLSTSLAHGARLEFEMRWCWNVGEGGVGLVMYSPHRNLVSVELANSTIKAFALPAHHALELPVAGRSEERRVGKECPV